MRKIPTLFERDETDRRFVTRTVTPGCEWALTSEGHMTRKWDGTCVKFDGEHWWARREVKPGKSAPDGYVPVETDAITGKTMGWEPAEQSSFAALIKEARDGLRFEPWTYELVGPKVNGNPEGWSEHALIPHGNYQIAARARTYDDLVAMLTEFPTWEGFVFWRDTGNPDAGMAKIKRRDLRELA